MEVIRENVSYDCDIRRGDIDNSISVGMRGSVVLQRQPLRPLMQDHAAGIRYSWQRLRRIVTVAQANERQGLDRRELLLNVLLGDDDNACGAEVDVPSSVVKVPMCIH